ncbi:sal-like protein 1 isoform X2 [Boleophthalmus pectinirostris]|uniref:sal-like protein 1 isoform X2 n=1 Tax=Boleophthalmus pectinirostris TaxID=150288 RepID=UPI00242C2A24|nr:sal-like protein 1 isoform X2 [Boleophthalmus pectinirostris]
MSLNTRAIHEQLSAIMSTLSRAALTQMCAAVDQGFSALHAELLRQRRDNDELRKKLHLIQSIVVHSAGGGGGDGPAEERALEAGGGGGGGAAGPGAQQQHKPGEPHTQEQGPAGGAGAEEPQVVKAPEQEEVEIKHEEPSCGGAVEEDMQRVDSRGAPTPSADHSAPVRTPSPEAGSSSGAPGNTSTFKCELLNLDLQVVEQHLSEPPSICGPIFCSSSVVGTQTHAQKVEVPAAWSSPFGSYQPENSDAFGLKVVSVSGNLSENSTLDFNNMMPGFGQSSEEKSAVRPRGRGRGRGLGVKRYVCTICQKVLTTAQALESHMRIHTGERPFKCEECGKRFTQACHLKSHGLSIHGNPPHPCPICGRGFSSLGTMQTHMKRWHPN